jgi:hypothetical protein
MKRLSLMLFVLALFSVFAFGLINVSPETVPVTRADSDPELQGSYGVRLEGSIFLGTSLAPAAIVGRLDIDNEGNVQGRRTLTVGGIPATFPATFSCKFTQVNPDGTGVLSCDVSDSFPAPGTKRTDVFEYVQVDSKKELELILVSGAPGSVISGFARRQ